MSFITYAVNEAITAFFLFFNATLIIVITLLWETSIFQFLDPNVQFPSVLENGHLPSLNPIWLPVGHEFGYAGMAQIGMDVSVNMSAVILNYIVAPFFSIMIIISGLSYLIGHTFYKNEKFSQYIPRIFISVILAYFSIFISAMIMEIGKAIYTFFYSGLYIQWSGSPNPVRGLESLQLWPFNYFTSNLFLTYTSNGFLEFLVLTTLFTALFVFFIVIVIRLIWIYFLIMTLPVASLFLMHPRTEVVGKRLWLSFIDRVFEICFMAPVLLLNIFIPDPIFWAAIFTVAMLIPGLVSFAMQSAGFQRGYSFFPRITIFDSSIQNASRMGMNYVSGVINQKISLLPKNTEGKDND